jgi:hypothetical protein
VAENHETINQNSQCLSEDLKLVPLECEVGVPPMPLLYQIFFLWKFSWIIRYQLINSEVRENGRSCWPVDCNSIATHYDSDGLRILYATVQNQNSYLKLPMFETGKLIFKSRSRFSFNPVLKMYVQIQQMCLSIWNLTLSSELINTKYFLN